MLVYGPVPSRRLGRSLGINNIPPKVCSYSCVYCQLGRTNRESIQRQTFARPSGLAAAVQAKVTVCRRQDEAIDYLAFVPDGEPTLDVNLGRNIDALCSLELPIAVISNGSLLDRDDVRRDLARADWVSLKVDAARESVWRKIDRPHGRLQLPSIQEGMRRFAADFTGTLCTETMLVRDLNDSEEELQAIADLLAQLKPDRAYLSVPTRPPSEPWALPAGEEALTRAYALFREILPQVELLAGYEGNAFAATEDAREDLLAITAVHPMRKEAVQGLLERHGRDWNLVTGLLAEGLLAETEHAGHRYYLRRFTDLSR